MFTFWCDSQDRKCLENHSEKKHDSTRVKYHNTVLSKSVFRATDVSCVLANVGVNSKLVDDNNVLFQKDGAIDHEASGIIALLHENFPLRVIPRNSDISYKVK